MNILFNSSKTGLFVCKNNDGKDIYFDAQNEASLAIIDNNYERLQNTVNGFVKSLADKDFEIVGFADDVLQLLDEIKLHDFTEFNEVMLGVASELKNRYELATKNGVSSITGYKKFKNTLPHIAVIIGCTSGKMLNQLTKNTSLADILIKGRAVGIFTCIYCLPKFISNITIMPSKPFDLIPFAADFVDYESIRDMPNIDSKFVETVEFVKSNAVINERLLQTKLKIGFNKACYYIEAMQNMGLISRQRYYTVSKKNVSKDC